MPIVGVFGLTVGSIDLCLARTHNPRVAGSSPAGPTNVYPRGYADSS